MTRLHRPATIVAVLALALALPGQPATAAQRLDPNLPAWRAALAEPVAIRIGALEALIEPLNQLAEDDRTAAGISQAAQVVADQARSAKALLVEIDQEIPVASSSRLLELAAATIATRVTSRFAPATATLLDLTDVDRACQTLRDAARELQLAAATTTIPADRRAAAGTITTSLPVSCEEMLQVAGMIEAAAASQWAGPDVTTPAQWDQQLRTTATATVDLLTP